MESLIYWRNASRSGAALGAGLALLVALACCSVVSVLAYGSLLALSAAVAFRVYRNVLQAVQKTNDGHPFKLVYTFIFLTRRNAPNALFHRPGGGSGDVCGRVSLLA